GAAAAVDGLGAARRPRAEPLLHPGVLDRADDAAHREHAIELGARLAPQLARARLDHLRALEEVLVLEQVRLVGEDLLDPQRPLLVPGARQPPRLVPGRELERATARLLRERDAERLERDADRVVLGLRLGEAEAVHLHAVAEAAQLGVLDAVAVARDLVPELRHRARLAHLLDEA